MEKILKEPLVHFLLLGLAIFLFYGLVNDDASSTNDTIIIDDNDIERLIQNFQKSWNEYPDKKTIKKLVDDYVRSEVLYNEALQLNLDHNDEIIKRRLMQKYEFLIEDLASQNPIEEETLKNYWQENKEKYKSPALYSFQQYYFNPDLVDDAQSLAKANLSNAATGKLKSHNSHLDFENTSLDKAQIARIYGQEFSKQLLDLETKKWTGPIKSGYGYHLVYITSTEQAEASTFETVKDNVTRDYRDQFLDRQNDQLYKAVKEKFEIDFDLDKYKDILL